MKKTNMQILEERLLSEDGDNIFIVNADKYPMIALELWIAETLDKCEEIGDGIGPIVIADLRKSMGV